jgi:hypothetical protein
LEEEMEVKLTIKRVPTVLSNYQEEGGARGCGRNCLGDCCLPGAYCGLSGLGNFFIISYLVLQLN